MTVTRQPFQEVGDDGMAARPYLDVVTQVATQDLQTMFPLHTSFPLTPALSHQGTGSLVLHPC